MVTLIYTFYQLSFILFMNRAARVDWQHKPWPLQQIAKSKSTNYILAYGLLLVAILLSIKYFGIGSGLFASCILLMTAGGLAVFILPFHFIKFRYVALLLGVFILIEFIS